MVNELPDIDSLLQRYAEVLTGESSFRHVELVKTAALYSYISRSVPTLAHEWATEELVRKRDVREVIGEMNRLHKKNLNELPNQEESSIAYSPIDPIALPYDLVETLIDRGLKRFFEHDQIVFKEGDPANHVFLVLEGQVMIKRKSDDNKEVILAVGRQGDLIGETEPSQQKREYITSAQMLTSGKLCMIDRPVFYQTLLEKEEWMATYLKWMLRKIQSCDCRSKEITLYDKRGAFYSTLLRLKNMYGVLTKDGYLISVYFTGKELAKMSGTTTFFIVREMKSLKEKGVIMNKGGMITIRDVEYLQSIVQCEKCPADVCRF